MNIICVDDEQPALDNFRLTVKDFAEIKSLKLFSKGEEALAYVREYSVDVAFLDMEMQSMHGMELARKIKEAVPEVFIIFVTAFEQYALQAFGVDAIGYLLKPYTREEVRKELEKVSRLRPQQKKRIVIQTIPGFAVIVDGNRMQWGRTKVEELFALFVDRANEGISVGEAIACLWPGRMADESTQSLYRMTYKRLMDTLRERGIDDIIATDGRKKYLLTEKVECDLYRILAGDREAIRNYSGEYMREYSWGESRNAQLSEMKLSIMS